MTPWDVLCPAGPVHKESASGWHVEHVLTPLSDGKATYQHNRRFGFALDELGRPFGALQNFGTSLHAQTVAQNIDRCAAGPVVDFMVPMAGGGARLVQAGITPTQVEEVMVGLTRDRDVQRATLQLRCATQELQWPANALEEAWQTFSLDSGRVPTDIDVRLIGLGLGWAHLVFASRWRITLSWSPASGWSCTTDGFSTAVPPAVITPCVPTVIDTVQDNPVSIVPGTQGASLRPDLRSTLGFTRQGWPVVMDSTSRFGFEIESAGIEPYTEYRRLYPGTDWNKAYCQGRAWVERQVEVKVLRPDGESTPLQVTFRRESRVRHTYFPALSHDKPYEIGTAVLEWEDAVTIRHAQPSGEMGEVQAVSHTPGRLTQYLPESLRTESARDAAICYMTAFGETSDTAYRVSSQQFGEMVAVYVDWGPSLAEGQRLEFVLADFGLQPLRQATLQDLKPTHTAADLIEPLWRLNPPVTVNSAREKFRSTVVRMT